MGRILAGLLMAAILWLVGAPAAIAQTFRVVSIANTDIGNVAAGTSGQTVFRTSAATGAVTRISGAGARISSGTARSLVTIRCGNQGACNTDNARVTVTNSGVPTNRAATLQNLTISASGATATIVTAPGGGAPISFVIGPVGRNSTKSFWLGVDLPINGDNSAAGTGVSNAQFAVTVSRMDGTRASSLTGTAGATVLRSLSVARTSNLVFGRVVRPSSGSGTVLLNVASGSVTVSGTGAVALPVPATSTASFSISGEGGQSISVAIPTSFAMSGPAGSITVTTAPNVSGAQILSGVAGAAGSLAINVGGSFNYSATTATGNYAGTLAVVAQYN